MTYSIGLLIFAVVYLLIFGLLTLWLEHCEKNQERPRKDDSKGYRSRLSLVDEDAFSKYMNPPEESTPTDEDKYHPTNEKVNDIDRDALKILEDAIEKYSENRDLYCFIKSTITIDDAYEEFATNDERSDINV